MKTIRTPKRLKRKILSALLAVSLVSIPISQPISIAPAAQASNITSLLGLAGLGMKINSYTKYNYSMPSDLSGVILCIATNNAASHPINGGVGTYSCHMVKVAKDSKYIFPAGYVTGSLTYSGSAGSTNALSLSMSYTKVTGYKDGKAVQETGSIPIVIQVTLTGTSTAITNSDSSSADPWSSNGTIDGGNISTKLPDITNTGNDTSGWDSGDSGNSGSSDVYPGGLPNLDGSSSNSGSSSSSGNSGHGTCYDGTYFCPESSNNGSSGNGGYTIVDGGSSSSGNLNDGTLDTDLPDQTWTDGSSSDGSSSGSLNYGDLIDDLLGDNSSSSYDSPNIDWSSSSGGSTDGDNLDDYFSGIDDAGSLPDGITLNDDIDDLTDNSIGNGGSGDNFYYDGGDTNNGGYVADNTPEDKSTLFTDFDALPAAYQDALAALNGTSNEDGSEADGLLGDMGDGDSLKDKLASLLNGDSTVSGNKKGTASDQDLFDYAKKFLLANGYSAAEIAGGKNYDDGSAYTEPAAAWDMNRITTLLKGRKISLTSPSEVQESKEEGSALSRVSKSSLTSPTKAQNNKANSGANDSKGTTGSKVIKGSVIN